MSTERLFATYRARHNKRKPERDYSFASTAREYARRLVADADASDRRELVALLNDVGVRDVTDSAHIIWDDARPRQMHLWPEGDRWGATPPLHLWNTALPVRTYTVCGLLVSNHLLYDRAGRGEWASHFRAFELVRQAAAASRTSAEPPRYTYDDERDARRICRDCAVASSHFPECFEGTNQGPPNWWFEPVRVEAADAIAAQLDRDRAFTSLSRLEIVATKAYRVAPAIGSHTA